MTGICFLFRTNYTVFSFSLLFLLHIPSRGTLCDLWASLTQQTRRRVSSRGANSEPRLLYLLSHHGVLSLFSFFFLSCCCCHTWWHIGCCEVPKHCLSVTRWQQVTHPSSTITTTTIIKEGNRFFRSLVTEVSCWEEPDAGKVLCPSNLK